MPNPLDLEIREHLARYLVGESTLREFREWFIRATDRVDLRVESPLRDLIGEIELRVAEFTSSHLGEDDLRSLLTPLIERYEIDMTHTRKSSATQVTVATLTYQQSVGGRPRASASA